MYIKIEKGALVVLRETIAGPFDDNPATGSYYEYSFRIAEYDDQYCQDSNRFAISLIKLKPEDRKLAPETAFKKYLPEMVFNLMGKINTLSLQSDPKIILSVVRDALSKE